MIDIPDFVYAKDASGNSLCPRCKKLVAKCDCPILEAAKPKQESITPKIRLDKSGRRGKMVTLIESLPSNELYLKDLAKTLKAKTGSGGTSYIGENGGTIELQGDHRKIVLEFIKNK